MSRLTSSVPSADAQLSEAAVGLLVDHLQRLYGSCARSAQLVIAPQRTYWSLSLEVLIVSRGGGNVFDAVTFAARAALFDLRIPRVRVTGATGRRAQEGKPAGSQRAPESMLKTAARAQQAGASRQGRVEFDLESYWDDGAPLQAQDDLPLSVTIAMVRWPCLGTAHLQYDGAPYIDADAIELEAASPRLHYAIDRRGRVVSMLLDGDGELDWAVARSCREVRRFRRAASADEPSLRSRLQLSSTMLSTTFSRIVEALDDHTGPRTGHAAPCLVTGLAAVPPRAAVSRMVCVTMENLV